MTRRGHGRPVGTLTAPARFSWQADGREPELGDVAFEVPRGGGDIDVLERAFLLVGIEETASTARPYRLTFERLDFADALARAESGTWWVWWKTKPGE